ncbi:MAG: hypothetical protein JM58_06020 [Peptococcaceae bacterium BICA1-8]|nr:MAG: hypothetical protein JM58_06020 [Peptococcaceae bacterium BICA1-8]
MLVIMMAEVLAVGTIGGLAFATGSIPDSASVSQEKVQFKQVSLAENLITEKSSDESMVEDLSVGNNSTLMPEVMNNEQFTQMQEYMNNLTSESFDMMNGFRR